MGRDEDATPRRRRDVLEAGVSRRALGKAPWVSPHRGFHRDTMVSDPVRQRILDAASVMPPDAAVAGWASAYLHGVPYLDGRGEPVLFVVPPRHQLKRPGIATVRAELDRSDVVTAHGLRCTSGLKTGFDMLRLARGLTAAVVAGDCLAHAGLIEQQAVLDYAGSRRGRRGIRQLREAIALVDPAAASPPESRLRMLCRFRAGLPSLLVNVPVYDATGAFLGIPDLLEPDTGLVIEYDGAYHRELGQHTADNLREERFESVGLTVVRVTALDLRNSTATAARLSRAHHRLIAVPHPHPSWTTVIMRRL